MHGILDKWYPSDKLNKFEGDFSILKDNQSVISLGKAVNLHYLRPATKRERCKCRGSCLTNRCPCKREERSCNSRCHRSSINCDNTSDESDLSVLEVPLDDVPIPTSIINNALNLIDSINDDIEFQDVSLDRREASEKKEQLPTDSADDREPLVRCDKCRLCREPCLGI